MFEPDIEALLLGHTGHVHQARAVGPCNVFCTRLYVALHFVTPHLGTDGGFLDGEHTAKAATLVRTLGLYDVNAVNKLQQVLYFVEFVDVFLTGA